MAPILSLDDADPITPNSLPEADPERLPSAPTDGRVNEPCWSGSVRWLEKQYRDIDQKFTPSDARSGEQGSSLLLPLEGVPSLNPENLVVAVTQSVQSLQVIGPH